MLGGIDLNSQLFNPGLDYSNYVINDANGNPVMVDGTTIDTTKADNADFISNITNTPYTQPTSVINPKVTVNQTSTKNIIGLLAIGVIIVLVANRR